MDSAAKVAKVAVAVGGAIVVTDALLAHGPASFLHKLSNLHSGVQRLYKSLAAASPPREGSESVHSQRQAEVLLQLGQQTIHANPFDDYTKGVSSAISYGPCMISCWAGSFRPWSLRQCLRSRQ